MIKRFLYLLIISVSCPVFSEEEEKIIIELSEINIRVNEEKIQDFESLINKVEVMGENEFILLAHPCLKTEKVIKVLDAIKITKSEKISIAAYGSHDDPDCV